MLCFTNEYLIQLKMDVDTLLPQVVQIMEESFVAIVYITESKNYFR